MKSYFKKYIIFITNIKILTISYSYFHFRERKIEELENKGPREKWYHYNKKKKGGSTNTEKQKHKPLFMLRPKKNKVAKDISAVKGNMKKLRK